MNQAPTRERTDFRGPATSKVQAPSKMPSFCVILPMYNEENSAVKCVTRLEHFLREVPARTAIIAVNDASTDGTLEVLKRLKKSCTNLMIIDRKVNGGYGEANRAGFQAALANDFDYALVMDGDGTQHPVFIEQFFSPMMSGIDLIKATRYSPLSRVEGVSWSRRLVSFVGNRLARAVLNLPLSDYTNGFRAIKTTLLNRIKTEDRGFSMLIEEVLQAKRLGATVWEVPYTLTARKRSESGSKFVYTIGVYNSYLKHLFNKSGQK